MKWFRFWMKSEHVDIQEYLEIPDEVAASQKLLKMEFEHWVAVRALSVDMAGCKKNFEFVQRPPVGWLIDKAANLKEEAKILKEKADRYNVLAADKGGRREETQMKWLAGSLFAEQKRVKPDRRKGKKA